VFFSYAVFLRKLEKTAAENRKVTALKRTILSGRYAWKTGGPEHTFYPKTCSHPDTWIKYNENIVKTFVLRFVQNLKKSKHETTDDDGRGHSPWSPPRGRTWQVEDRRPRARWFFERTATRTVTGNGFVRIDDHRLAAVFAETVAKRLMHFCPCLLFVIRYRRSVLSRDGACRRPSRRELANELNRLHQRFSKLWSAVPWESTTLVWGVRGGSIGGSGLDT